MNCWMTVHLVNETKCRNHFVLYVCQPTGFSVSLPQLKKFNKCKSLPNSFSKSSKTNVIHRALWEKRVRNLFRPIQCPNYWSYAAIGWEWRWSYRIDGEEPAGYGIRRKIRSPIDLPSLGRLRRRTTHGGAHGGLGKWGFFQLSELTRGLLLHCHPI